MLFNASPSQSDVLFFSLKYLKTGLNSTGLSRRDLTSSLECFVLYLGFSFYLTQGLTNALLSSSGLPDIA